MGIPGLLQVLRPVFEKKHARQFSRRRVGVDVYAWLHKGAFACAGKLCTGQPTTMYVDYVLERVKMLLHYEVIPVLVFDGAPLPMKEDTHKERRARREDNLRKANEALQRGDRRTAEKFFQNAVPVTSDMARDVIKQCRRINVEYVVAPFEADAQLAWMTLNGQIDCVLTEDSDLVVYGAKSILYKMTKDGECDLFQMKNLASLENPPMYNISPDMFMWMCVSAGCDFFEGVKNLGVKRAHGLVKKHRTLSRLLHAIRADLRYPVSRDFMTHFYRACLVFRHQTVFDTTSRKAAHLSFFEPARIAMLPSGVIPTGSDGEPDLGFLGVQHSESIIQRIAKGFIHPSSLKEYLDPLDVVERPIRNNSTTRAKMSALTSPSSKGTGLRSFQVLRAKQPVPGVYRPAENLRSRLSRGPQSFNPRHMASQLTPRGISRKRGATSLPASSIWSKFKRPARQAGPDDLSRSCGIGGEKASEVKERRKNVCQKSGRRFTEELPSAKRARRFSSGATVACEIPALLPKNSVKRFLTRFSTPETAKRSAVLDVPERSPSPEKEPCALLAKAEDEGSCDACDPTHGGCNNFRDAEATVGRSPLVDENRIIRSRFFAMGKRLTLQPHDQGTSSRERPLIREVANSVSEKTSPDLSRKHARGRPVLNKAFLHD